MSTAPQIQEVSQPQLSRARAARDDLLERIVGFITKHDLNVTGANLASIGTALSGSNSALAQAFVTREISGEPIDQRWLDTVGRLDPEIGDRMNDLEVLMDKMENSLLRFAQTTKDAKDATNEQAGALGDEIKALAKSGGEPGAGIDRIIELSNAVLDRVEDIESALEKSKAEGEELRESLAEARIEADIDHLTRLPNRRAFERQLKMLSIQAQEKQVPISVAFCDIDHFKSINDTHGHDAGDRVLAAFAKLLMKHANPQCFVARHGGEEFVILFYAQDHEVAWRVLDGMRRVQASKQMINRESGKSFGKITFSAGVADIEGPEDAREALARADAALYEAKANGRNQIVSYEPPEEPEEPDAICEASSDYTSSEDTLTKPE